MTRPCFLVIDREFAGSISTRKLVIETAKFNVITAYSSLEAIETVRRFPAIDGVVMDTGMRDMNADDVVKAMKEIVPTIQVISISSPGMMDCRDADFHLDSFEPAKLLALLRKLLPSATAEIEDREEKLHGDHGQGTAS